MFSIPAAGQTWDGGGADNNWTTIANWNPDGAPANNGTANIIMAGAVDPAPIVNANQDILSLTFSNTAGAFTIGGANTLTLRAGGITNNDAGTQTINAPIVLLGSQQWNGASGPLAIGGATINLSANTLTLLVGFDSTISNAISGVGGSIVKSGTSNVTFSGGSSNTYNGTTTVNVGTLILQKSAAVAAVSNTVIVGDGAGTDTLALGANEQIPVGATVTVHSSGVFNLAGFNETFLVLNVNAGSVTTGVGTLNIGTSLTMTGGSVASTGAGQLLLAGALFTNAAATSATISGNANLGGVVRNFTVANGAAADDLDVTAVISNGGINKLGAGTLTLSGNNTYAGLTTISAGSLALGAANTLPDATSVTATGTLDLADFSDTINGLSGAGSVTLGTGTLSVGSAGANDTFSGVISGTGGLTKVGAGQQKLSGANMYTGSTAVSAGSLLIGANERLADTSSLTVAGGTFDLQSFNETVDQVTVNSGSIIGTGTLSANTFVLQSGVISAPLGGTGTLFKSTGGIGTLGGSCTYTGNTFVNGGTLRLGANNVLPDLTFLSLGGTLDMANFSDTIGVLSGDGNVLLGAGSLAVGFDGDNNFYTGVMSGTGNFSKSGTGVLSLGGVNTYTGLTTVNAGEVKITSNERLANASDLTLAGGTFNLQPFSETLDVVTLATGAIVGAGTLSANAFNVHSGAIGADLGGSAGMTKTTAGTVTLSGANNFTGVTAINGGVLELSNLPSTSALSFNGGTLRTTNSLTVNAPITFNSGGATFDTIGTTTLTGPISGNGALTKAGLGALVINSGSPPLAGLNVNSGDLELPVGGTLNVTGAATIGSGGFVSLNAGAISAGSIMNSGDIELRDGARLTGPLTNSGVLTGIGRVSGVLTNTAAGEVRVGLGESLHFTTTSAGSNAGEIEVIGGEIEFEGPVTNSASTGLIFARNAGLRFDGGLTNAGSMALSFGVTDVFGDIANQGGANIVVSGHSDATFIDDVVNNGVLRTSAGSASVFFGAVSGTGSFPGTGTVFLEGDLRPGSSPARVIFGGDVVLGASARLTFELGGDIPADQYDQVVIDGDVVLDGVLEVQLINDFFPSAGQQFELMTYASRLGDFSTVALPVVPGLCLEVVAGPTSLTLFVNQVLGDANADCRVSLDDYSVLPNCVSGPGGAIVDPLCHTFDFDTDDDVDLLDFGGFQVAFTAP